MKKIILTLMSVVLFTACSHDFDYYSPSELVTKEYEAKFVENFGFPAVTQTWGFGSVAGARALTRAIESSYAFPSDADESKFLSEVPAGVSKLTQNNASVNGWIDETWSGELNVWGQYDPSIPPYGGARGGTLYVKGNCDFSNRKFYFAGHSELYLISGATLTLNAENAANLQENTMIYIAEGAKIVTDGELKLNKGLHIYNHGTIEAPKISTNSNSVLYNVGTITIDGKISVENDLSVFVNDGTLTAKELNTAGSGKVQNNGEATIDGVTTINSNSNTWVNNGKYTTGEFRYTAGSKDVINNCKLTVKGEFYINLGDCDYGTGFYVDGGVVAGSFKMDGPGYIYLASNSVFKVDGTATMNCTKAKYGIYGIGNDWSVFQADKIVAGAENQEYLVTYGGKLAVVTGSHFAQATEGRPYYDVVDEATLYVNGDSPEVTIEETECNPGFTGKKGTDEFTFLCRVFAEDLSVQNSTDFDFNDVVFDVYRNKNGLGKIVLLAAGGTLQLQVCGVEVHDAFGLNDTEVMVNTGYVAGAKTAEKDSVVIAYVEGINSIADVNSKVKVEVFKQGLWIEMTAYTGQVASKFAVTKQIRWCKERKNINDVYEQFQNWVGNPENTNWYEVVKDNSGLY